MKPTETESSDTAGPGPDKLSQLLIWATIFLVAVSAAIAADLWVWPSSGTTLALAVTTEVPALCWPVVVRPGCAGSAHQRDSGDQYSIDARSSGFASG
jgi:hypothetical protein